jgi:ParB-like chromosome segregation protein Spo0J
MKCNKKIETWDIDKLKPHPSQAKVFPAPPQQEVEELAARFEADGGMLCEIEALPDGTIVCGHKRRLAARHLGWTTVKVWVRDDLLAQGESAVEERLVWDNLSRRQLGPLGLARCYQHLKKLGLTNPKSRLLDSEKRELRDQIGKRLKMSGRNLDRYLRVLEGTPQAVQDAVEADKLVVTLAEKVAGLPKAQRDQIAQEIVAGGKPTDVVRRFVAKGTGRHQKPQKAMTAFLKALDHGVADLEGRPGGVGWINGKGQQTLERAAALIEQLQEKARQQPEEPPSCLDEILAAAEEYRSPTQGMLAALDAEDRAGGPDNVSGCDATDQPEGPADTTDGTMRGSEVRPEG